MSMEIWGPLGPGERQPGGAGWESLLPPGRLRCCPRIPQGGSDRSEVAMEGHLPPHGSQASQFAAAPLG